MWLTDYGGIRLPFTQYESQTPRVARFETLPTSGNTDGEYSMFQDSAPFAIQEYSYTFRWPRPKLYSIDLLAALVGTRQLLTAMMIDRSKRQTTATLTGIEIGSTVEDEVNSHLSVGLTFRAEPFWYGLPWRSIGFTNTASFSVSNAQGNLGNVRAIKYLILYIYNNITGSVGSPFTITVTDVSSARVYRFYLEANMSGSSGTPITIDCGANTVRASGVDRYKDTSRPTTQLPFLALEPGAQTVTFTTPVSGRFDFKDTWK